MGRRKESITIGEAVFHVEQVGARDGLRLLLLMAKSVLPAMKVVAPLVAKAREFAASLSKHDKPGTKPRTWLRRLLDGEPDQALESEMLEALVAAVSKFFELARPEDFDEVVAGLLLKGTTEIEQGKGRERTREVLTADAFDDHFAGDYLAVFRLLAFALRLNYVSFSAARSALQKLGATDAGESSGSETSSTSSGPSSGS